jgi:hypothetical protein
VCFEKLQHLAGRALAIMDKHGLLTMADDPEVAAVFAEERPPCPACLYYYTEGSVPPQHTCEPPRTPASSPARMSYAESEPREYETWAEPIRESIRRATGSLAT